MLANSPGLIVRFHALTPRGHWGLGILLTALLLLLAVVGTLVHHPDLPLGGATHPPSTVPTPRPAPAPVGERIQASFGKLPLYFIENRGQSDPRVAYYIHGADTSVYFTADGLTLAQREPAPPVRADAVQSIHRARAREPAPARPGWAVQLAFVGAAPVLPQGRARTDAVVSYFKGPKSQWKAGLPTYTEIVYPDLWPGIDLVYGGDGGRLKTTFHVRPGADPQRIQLAYRGTTEVTLTDAGRLAVWTPVGRFEEDRPLVYQDIAGQRVPVEARYTLAQAGEGEWRYGFALGAYDPSRPLVIDPVVLVYCGYIGGSGSGDYEVGRGIAVDDLGQAYVVGETTSTQYSPHAFPVIGGPDLTHNGVADAFVAKVSADGTHLIYAGYIGGGNGDYGNGIAVDGSGQAYVVGRTYSAEDSFPVVGGPDLTYNGDGDAFVAKVSADGTHLLYAGYIGGGNGDYGNGIAVDGSGQAYVVGWTDSAEASFPVVGGPDLTFNGDVDTFVAKVSADGAHLVYAGYIGGGGWDGGNGIALDDSGQAYVVGGTNSTKASFPVVGGPDLTYNGGDDAFVAKVSADGTHLVYAGYIGGRGSDFGYGIALDNSGQAYVVGITGLTEAAFPVVGGPDLTFNGVFDAFVAKVSADGTHLLYAGYIGGDDWDYGYGIAVDGLGQATVVGATFSTEASFPVVGGPDLTFNGDRSAFVAKVSADGAHLVYAGYIGEGYGYGIAVDGLGQAYVVGSTYSAEASFPVVGGPDLTYNYGSGDAFVAKLAEDPDTDLALTLEAAPEPVSAGQPLTYTLTVANNGPQEAPSAVVTDTLPAGVTFGSASSGCGHDGAATVTCALDALGAGARARVTLVVVPTTQAIGAIRNRAVVSTGFDPDPSNNSATVTTTVDPPAEQADLALTLDDDPDPVLSWEPLTYTLTVTNAGPSTAAGVVLADTLPPGLAVLALSSGCSHAGGTVTCVLGDVAKNATVQASIQVAPHRWRPTLRNTATVRSAATWDSDPNNNWAHQTTAMWLGGGAGLGILVNGTGSVRSDPTGIQCPGDCGERYPAGTTVVLSAAPAAQFVGWEGACAGTAPTLPVVLGGATLQVCQANFAEPTGQLGDSGGLGMFVNGPGSVRSEPAGLTCPGDCRASYPADTTVVLSAEPAAQFLGWEGACAGAAPTLPVVVAGATTQFCQANFAEPTPAP